jgi:uncharacterized protein YijF (DUF1287 family)
MRRHVLGSLLLLSAASTWASPALDLVAAAKSQIGVTLHYDPSYQRLAYPRGDVPIERGVCTDVVVRAYRKLGIDLQERVHRDMRQAWDAYPHPANWGLKKPDTNIDHRRVPNLAAFFGRHGITLATSRDARDYKPGDIVVWRLPPSLPHIGIVSDKYSANGTPLVIHNIGAGARMEDALFSYAITGHYRFL